MVVESVNVVVLVFGEADIKYVDIDVVVVESVSLGLVLDESVILAEVVVWEVFLMEALLLKLVSNTWFVLK